MDKKYYIKYAKYKNKYTELLKGGASDHKYDKIFKRCLYISEDNKTDIINKILI